MRIFVLFLLIGWQVSGVENPKENKEEFRKNLAQLLDRTEKSVKILREQILSSQSAPFLGDLYLQLGELLSTKASALYFIQMEREGKNENAELSNKTATPIVEVQREAIEVYLRILHDFPKFPKRVMVYYYLANSLKAIDDIPRFIQLTEKMEKEFPEAKETIRAQLLLGQLYFDKGMMDKAKEAILPVTRCSLPFEKAMAKHRLALILLSEEKAEQSLKLFEEVVQAGDFTDEESPMEVSLKTGQIKASLRREALLDSIRAYTIVYVDSPNPATYYSRIAPNEILFYEVLEKLAQRYITLKKYDQAIKLIRVLTARTNDPQKVVNMYRDVLLATPIQDRLDITPGEMRHVLERLNKWLTYYKVNPQDAAEAQTFFETQVRDLATRGHDFAKEQKDPNKKELYLDRSRKYYQLYLAYFKAGGERKKLALNLADIFFSKGKFLESSDLYMRASSGEFGPVDNRKELLDSAIATAQKTGEFSYYEQLRIRGILIRAIKTQMEMSPKLAKDARLNFLLLKTRYEQGFFGDVIPRMFSFVESNPSSKYAVYAGELILDYFNTRKDFESLMQWSEKISHVRGVSKDLLAKVSGIKSQAAAKLVDQRIKENTGFDQFEQGKSYLKSAYSLTDETLKSVALQKALSKSKEEGDVGTFFETAGTLAKGEGDIGKKTQIVLSVSKERAKLTQYYEAVDDLRQISATAPSPGERAKALGEAVELALLLRDWELIEELSGSPLWSQLPGQISQKVHEQAMNLLESPVSIPDSVVKEVLRGGANDSGLLALYKATPRMGGSEASRVKSEVSQACASKKNLAACKWEKAKIAEENSGQLAEGLARAPASVQSVEEKAKAFMAMVEGFKQLENSGDPQLDMAIALKETALFQSFGAFLNKVANASPEFKDVLQGKIKESQASSATQLARCRKLAERTTIVTPANRYCLKGEVTSIDRLLYWNEPLSGRSKKGSAKGVLGSLEAQLFGGKGGADAQLRAASRYLEAGYLHHAAAAASLGSASYPDKDSDFKAILGCSLARLGLLSEAGFHLKMASGYQGLGGRCQAAIREAQERL